MVMSILTQKGQTTIPKEVRDLLHLKQGDKVVYVRDGQRVYMQTVRGSAADVAGIFKRPLRKSVDFKKLREKTKALVAAKADKR